MARGFRIHSNAVFNPFSYQELIAPLNEYEQAYGQMQDAMLAAGEEANQYKQLIDTDPYASGILNRYNNTLSEMSSKLSSDGLKSINRNSLLNLRRQYNNEVKPINDAAKTLASLQDTYRQAYMKDNTLMRGAMPSIRDLVENPGATPHIVSGSSLYSQGAQAAKAASARKQDFQVRLNGLVNGYIDTVQRTGYNSEEANQFLNAAMRQPELQEIVTQIYGANRVGELDNPNQGMDWIVRGVFDGLAYDQKNDLKYNQYAAEMRAAARKAAGANVSSSFPINTFNLYSQKQRSESAKNIDKYSKYFTPNANGTFSLNKEGKNAYKASYTTRFVGDTPTVNSEFNRFIRTISRDNETPDQAWTRYVNESSDAYFDMTRETGYRYQPQSDDINVLKDILTLDSDTKGKLSVVDYDTKKQEYVKTNDTISIDDVKKGTVGNIEVSDKGITVDVNNGKGTYKVMLPIKNPYQYNNARTIIRNLHDIETAMTQYALQDESYRGSQEEAYHWMQYSQRQQELYNAIANILRTYNSNPVKL